MRQDDTECTCEAYESDELHPCPYAEDIDNDPTPCCTCCPHCESECAMDI